MLHATIQKATCRSGAVKRRATRALLELSDAVTSSPAVIAHSRSSAALLGAEPAARVAAGLLLGDRL